MLEQIGFKAGEVYSVLEKNGPLSIYALKKELKNERDIIPMAIGWLAREGKIAFQENGKSSKISIK